MFQRFWRGRPAGEDGVERRTGLGLTIVRQVVEAHGGEVKLVSAPGVGSTFALWLPRRRRDRRRSAGAAGRSGRVRLRRLPANRSAQATSETSLS